VEEEESSSSTGSIGRSSRAARGILRHTHTLLVSESEPLLPPAIDLGGRSLDSTRDEWETWRRRHLALFCFCCQWCGRQERSLKECLLCFRANGSGEARARRIIYVTLVVHNYIVTTDLPTPPVLALIRGMAPSIPSSVPTTATATLLYTPLSSSPTPLIFNDDGQIIVVTRGEINILVSSLRRDSTTNSLIYSAHRLQH
jgi:hypothetical protein